MKNISLIVPVWCNTEESYQMTINAIDGMLQTQYDSFDLVLVDDCSPLSDTFQRLLDRYGKDNSAHIQAIAQTPHNMGSTAAVNIGIGLTQSPYIQYQNNDTLFPDPNWLNEQMKLFEDPEVGIVGCLMRYDTGLIQHAGACWRSIDDHSIDHIGQYQKEIKYLEDVPFVTGCGMTVRRKILDGNGGGFTEFKGYGWDDIDIQVKAKQWGWKIKVAPKATFTHLGSVSYKARPELNTKDNYLSNKANFSDIIISKEETIQHFIDNYYL